MFVASRNGNEATVWVSNGVCTVQHVCLDMFFRHARRESADVCKRSAVHIGCPKRQLWLAPTEDVFLMICSDVQVESTLRSDMDHWVHRGLSELTSEDLPPSRCIAIALTSQGKKELYWHEWEQENVVKPLSPLKNVTQWDKNRLTCTSIEDWHFHLSRDGGGGELVWETQRREGAEKDEEKEERAEMRPGWQGRKMEDR